MSAAATKQPSLNPFQEEECPDCFGGGYDLDARDWWEKCLRCGGSGRVYTEHARRRLEWFGPRDLSAILNPTPERIAELRAMPYRDYLYTQEWRQRRAMHIRQANFTCDRCGARERNYGKLQVHHKTYDRLGHEDRADLEVLCVECHRREHGIDA